MGSPESVPTLPLSPAPTMISLPFRKLYRPTHLCLADAHIVEWSPSGEKYVVVVLNRIDVYQLATASVSGTIEAGRRVSAVAFLEVGGGARS